jgi:peptide/nickel transport system ATP-binding protein
MNDTATDIAPAGPSSGAQPLVHVDNLHIRFVGRERTIDAVNGVSFSVDAGEVLCILGESGSGKSVTLRAMMRLHPPHLTKMSGTVTVAGKDILGLGGSALSDLRGPEVAMIFQEPMTSFDPVFTVGTQACAGTARDGADPVT